MKSFSSLLCSLAIFQTLASSTAIPSYFQPTPILSSAQVQRELGNSLSKTTTIFGPDDGRFVNATERWDVVAIPRVQVVIQPGQESDISKIVSSHEQYCY